MYFRAVTLCSGSWKWEPEREREPGWSKAGWCDVTGGPETWWEELRVGGINDDYIKWKIWSFTNWNDRSRFWRWRKSEIYPPKPALQESINTVIPAYLEELRKHQINTEKHERCTILGTWVQKIKFVMYTHIQEMEFGLKILEDALRMHKRMIDPVKEKNLRRNSRISPPLFGIYRRN